MAKNDKPKKLLVEGQDDLRVIPELIEKNGIFWGNKKEEAIISIQECGGYENITSDLIYTELQTRGRTHLGLMVDADDDAFLRWQSIRNACFPNIPNLPEALPENGLIINTPDNQKFGVWIMPNNIIEGMLETFLGYMIPEQGEYLWEYAQEVVREAKNKGATFKESYIDKAEIYTWLAWQNEPGRQIHQAIKYNILNPNNPKVQGFINWFKELYDL
ncbi:hypothetical protein H5968_11430 [Sphaerospermopsis sp. LEGE 00249]|jgi:hypothetical protein|uniref:DUF3226 domain-containing protein n=1 Tax=Sphaerospermopsis sp. LEGE 00249 TaxID=1380707 RepID=UPI00164E5FBD|nr:DUF3226 domain-containing protein [Sphaerospermopsis sp. LEGE 00249]MBC5795740.1 hypothetical protein [Sphaerospermopsis sp. LEGE 00249]